MKNKTIYIVLIGILLITAIISVIYINQNSKKTKSIVEKETIINDIGDSDQTLPTPTEGKSEDQASSETLEKDEKHDAENDDSDKSEIEGNSEPEDGEKTANKEEEQTTIIDKNTIDNDGNKEEVNNISDRNDISNDNHRGSDSSNNNQNNNENIEQVKPDDAAIDINNPSQSENNKEDDEEGLTEEASVGSGEKNDDNSNEGVELPKDPEEIPVDPSGQEWGPIH